MFELFIILLFIAWFGGFTLNLVGNSIHLILIILIILILYHIFSKSAL